MHGQMNVNIQPQQSFMIYLFIMFQLLLTLPLQSKCLEIETLLGKEIIEDPMTVELIESSAFQRLKSIDQHGIISYCNQTPTFNRFDHSVSVYALLKRYQASYLEQIAGLLHDLSHTVFSHVGDYLFMTSLEGQAYQDKIQAWYMQEVGIGKILNNYGYTIQDVLDDNPLFQCLEQPLPDLCADRIEYILHTAKVFGLISQDQIEDLLGALKFENNCWYFDQLDQARKLADFSLHFTQNFWGDLYNSLCNEWFAKALKIALEEQIISLNDIHFSTDLKVLDLLRACTNSSIQNLISLCWNPTFSYNSIYTETEKTHITPKFRGVNPWVKKGSSLHRLSDLDPEFNINYLNLKEEIQRGPLLNEVTLK